MNILTMMKKRKDEQKPGSIFSVEIVGSTILYFNNDKDALRAFASAKQEVPLNTGVIYSEHKFNHYDDNQRNRYLSGEIKPDASCVVGMYRRVDGIAPAVTTK